MLTRLTDTPARLSRWAPVAGLALLLVVAVAGSGCSTRNDPHYNRYNPTDNRPALLETADYLVDIPAEALDNLDERAENIIY